MEWDVVFLVGVCEEKFPHTRSRGLWPTRLEILPSPLRGDARDLPVLRGYDEQALAVFREDAKAHELTEELRLAYVALTRARHELVVSSYVWAEGRKTPLGPSPYQLTLRRVLDGWGERPLAWLDKPEKGTPNPLWAHVREVPWPVTERTEEALLRLDAAERVRAALGGGAGGAAGADEPATGGELDMIAAERVAVWDEEIERLLAESRREAAAEIQVPLPAGLSATSLARLRDDPQGFAAELARPMPRPPSAAARFGTRFHEWVESRFGQQDLIDPDELPGRADVGIDDYADLRGLIELFEAGPFRDRPPARLEAPFSLVLAGQVVRGRIDAVYAEPDGGWLVVDWKTSRAQADDPLQLAVYRVAWAELVGVPVDRVRAGFYYVRSQQLVEPEALPGRAELESLVVGGEAADGAAG
ncbi:MAG: 3'-5' exonuclease [Nocardioides sp.]